MSWFSNLFKTKKDNFDLALKIVLGFEGGLSDHKADKGGLTNFGVTQKTYDQYRIEFQLPTQSVKLISKNEVREIYRIFWNQCRASQLPARAGIAVFDMAINSGSGTALKYWKLSQGSLEKFFVLRENFYRSIVEKNASQKVFLKGWLNRLKHLKTNLEKIGE